MTRKKVSTCEKLGGSKADGCRRPEAVEKIRPRRSNHPTPGKPFKPVTNATFLSKHVRFFPKEHRSSPLYDSRVYIPTIDDFFADTQQGSMLDEVKLLPLEDLASLMYGSEVYCIIKDTPLGTDLLHLSEELQENHAELDLRLIAKAHSVRRHTLPLLLHEGCSDEFLLPIGISAYLDGMLFRVVSSSQWRIDVKQEFSNRLSHCLTTAVPRVPLIPASFYSYEVFRLECIHKIDVRSLQETLAMDAEDVILLMECLLANILRFFVLYSVHGLRDQVRVRVSGGGEVLYQLKHSPLQVSPSYSWQVNSFWKPLWVSDEGFHKSARLLQHVKWENWIAFKRIRPMLAACQTADAVLAWCWFDAEALRSLQVLSDCIPLPDDFDPTVRDLETSNDSSSLLYQVAHLPAAQIVRLLLGERIFYCTACTFPEFISHLEQYAALLKCHLSTTGNWVPPQPDKVESQRGALKFIDACIHRDLSFLRNWAQHGKASCVRKVIMKALKSFSAKQPGKPIWNSYLENQPPKLYYPLKRFTSHSLQLPRSLLQQISRSFDRFFLTYAIHALRYRIKARVVDGSLLFSLRRKCSPFRVDIPISEQQKATNPTSVWSTESDRNEQFEGSSAAAVKTNVKTSDDVPSEVRKECDSASATVEPTSIDADGELGFYQKVMQNGTLPAYFKTTLGILVANNRDLREERAFLLSRLGLSGVSDVITS